MARGRRFVVSAATVAVVGAFAPAATAGEDAVWSRLHREDAFAAFEIQNSECRFGRTQINLGFHVDVFESSTSPRSRNVVFGVAVNEYDCAGQSAESYEGNDTEPRRFGVSHGLGWSKVHTTMQMCQTLPATGTCVDVRIDLVFKGTGAIDVDRDATHIREPECRIDQLFLYRTRDAEVRGELTYTSPDGVERTHQLTTEVLTRDGATLSTGFERSYRKGSGGSCIEAT